MSSASRYRAWLPRSGAVRALTLGLMVAGALPGVTGGQGSAGTPAAPNTGTLEGIIRWVGGEAPAAVLVTNVHDPRGCPPLGVLSELRLDANGGIADAVVRLVDAQPVARRTAAHEDTVVLDNEDCRFVPRVSVLRLGGTIVGTSSDETLHTEHFTGPFDTNIALPEPGMRVRVTATAPGRVLVRCELHPWMRAWIQVDPHPHHAVSDAAGRFRIAGLPAGSRTVEVWHERLGPWRVEVEIVAGATTVVEPAFDEQGLRDGSDPVGS